VSNPDENFEDAPRVDYRLKAQVAGAGPDLRLTWEKGNADSLAVRESQNPRGLPPVPSMSARWEPMSGKQILLESRDVLFGADSSLRLSADLDGAVTTLLSGLKLNSPVGESIEFRTYPAQAPEAALAFRLPTALFARSSPPPHTGSQGSVRDQVLMTTLNCRIGYQVIPKMRDDTLPNGALTRFLQLKCERDLRGRRLVLRDCEFRMGANAGQILGAAVVGAGLGAGAYLMLRDEDSKLRFGAPVTLGVSLPLLAGLFGGSKGVQTSVREEPLVHLGWRPAAGETLRLAVEGTESSLVTNSAGIAEVEVRKLPRDSTGEKARLKVVPRSQPRAGRAFPITGLARPGSVQAIVETLPPVDRRFARPRLAVFARFDDSAGNGNCKLDAGETGRLRLMVVNVGGAESKGDTINLVPLQDDTNLDFKRRIRIPPLPVDSGGRFDVPITAGCYTRNDSVRMKVETMLAGDSVDWSPTTLAFASAEPALPSFELKQEDPRPRHPTVGCEFDITCRIINRGPGTSFNLTVQVSVPPGARLLSKSDRFGPCPKIPPGYRTSLTLRMATDRSLLGDELTAMVVLTQPYPVFTETLSIRVPLTRFIEPQDTTEPFSLEDVGNPPRIGIQRPGIAVIIGSRATQDSFSIRPAKFARLDAVTMSAYAENVLGYTDIRKYLGSITGGNLIKLFGTQEHEGDLANGIKAIGVDACDLFVYYSGHGCRDSSGETYLVSWDCEPRLVEATGYKLSLLIRKLQELPARSVTLVIDACFSGKCGDGSSMFCDVSGSGGSATERPLPDLKQVNLFSACGSYETANWWDQKQHGLFSWFFFNGLLGEADKNGDNEITNGEMAEYLSQKVLYRSTNLHGTLKGRPQHPVFQGDPSAVLARLSSGR
jgi:hypothetical protein